MKEVGLIESICRLNGGEYKIGSERKIFAPEGVIDIKRDQCELIECFE